MPLTWESRETSHQTLTEAFVYAEDASQRKSRGLLGGLFHWTFRHLSIAVIPDSSAHAGSTEADTARVLIAAPLDVTLARRIAGHFSPLCFCIPKPIRNQPERDGRSTGNKAMATQGVRVADDRRVIL